MQCTTKYRGVEQLVARRAHNPEVAGSSPVPATTKLNHPTGWFNFCAVSYAHGCDRRVPGAQLPSAPGGRYRQAVVAQRTKFIGAPSRNKF